MEDVLSIALPIVALHVVVLLLIVAFIRLIVGGLANRTVTRVRLVEDEVRKKEEAIKHELEDHEREFTRQKREADKDLQAQREESKREIARLKEQAVIEAKKEGAKIIEQAHKNEQQLRDQIAHQLEEKSVEYGGKVFRLVFSDIMSDALNKQFVRELLDALGEIEKGSIAVESERAEVTVSHPLDTEQRERLEALLKDKFGDGVTLAESVDATILGGLVLKIGTLEIDGSLRNRYHEAVNEVKREAQAA